MNDKKRNVLECQVSQVVYQESFVSFCAGKDKSKDNSSGSLIKVRSMFHRLQLLPIPIMMLTRRGEEKLWQLITSSALNCEFHTSDLA